MSSGLTHRLPAAHRIKKRPEFLAIRNSGRLHRTPHFLVQTCSRSHGPTRLGVTVSRHVGIAVVRNRIKRHLREFFRLHYHLLPAMTDISIVARKGSDRLSGREIQLELAWLLGESKGDTVGCSDKPSSR